MEIILKLGFRQYKISCIVNINLDFSEHMTDNCYLTHNAYPKYTPQVLQINI